MSDRRADERESIRLADEYLTAVSGVVVDDIVLRTWGNGQAELVQLLLSAAVEASGGVIEQKALWKVSRSVAFPDRDDAPWFDASGSAGTET